MPLIVEKTLDARKLTSALEEAQPRIVGRLGAVAAQMLAQRSPVRTGALRDSLDYRVTRGLAEVFSPLDYADIQLALRNNIVQRVALEITNSLDELIRPELLVVAQKVETA